MMKRSAIGCALAGLSLVLFVPSASHAQDVQQKVAAAKQAAAENQQALRSYSWIEKTEISVKGEVKNTKIEQCHYGPDGKVQKTALSAPPEEDDSSHRGRKRRVREHVVEKKTEEMKEEMQAASALVHQYVPPSPESIEAARAAGKISLVPGAGTASLRIADYEKAGDALVLTLDSADKAMTKIDVNTWLDSPDQSVTLDVQMASLPAGPSYAGTIVLSIPSSQIEVRITNTNYEKIVP
jgi:hypothetical protein